jgi:DNA (cytosine-5)-methyltransferase 1
LCELLGWASALPQAIACGSGFEYPPFSIVYTSLDFFAGSGLVRLGLEPEFQTLWANDICPKKKIVYEENFGAETFCGGSIENVDGAKLPAADLAWASFPCQDLSLAGNLTGMKEGTRSGLFWQWLRVLDEMHKSGKRPPLLIAENVVGFVVANGGKHFKTAYEALRSRRYRVGAIVVDAELFLPQSRPRAFLIAVQDGLDLGGLTQDGPSGVFHTDGLIRTASKLDGWIWWSLREPSGQRQTFSDLCEHQAPCDPKSKTQELRGMLSPVNRKKLKAAIEPGKLVVGTGYRRTRPDDDGVKRQRLELRFDGVAGCLRTPEGGSSRQVVMIVDHGDVRTRLMTVRETARLMGAPDTFKLSGSYNDGYRAMGDAVAVPVTRWVTCNLLAPLAGRYRSARDTGESAA